MRNRNKTDINFKLGNNIRSRINSSLRGKSKSARTLELIECSIEFLKEHLEKQFLPGMTWDNYGKNGWEIDHIIPCRAFNLSKPKEQKKCFHWTNLQPLWGIDNSKKNDKLPTGERARDITR